MPKAFGKIEMISSQGITYIQTMSEIEIPRTGSWWSNEKGELIQIVGDDHVLVETVCPVHFKYWDGPRTNEVTGCGIDEFYSEWTHKFG